MEGWYYLHTNGELIFKRELDGNTAADISESPFARAMWPVDPSNRENAWTLLVEALAGKRRKSTVMLRKWIDILKRMESDNV